MQIGLEFTGLSELIKAVESAASDSEIGEINKRIVERSQVLIKDTMSGKMPKSSNISMSGRGFGSKASVSSHAADSIPVGKVRQKETGAEADVGWTKADNSEHFYVKFINWGTTKRPPQEFIYQTGREVDRQIQEIAEQEYQTYLNRTMG